MAEPFVALVTSLPAAASLGLAVWLMLLDWRDPLHRALFLLLFTFGVQYLLHIFTGSPDDLPGRALVYFALAAPFAALNLLFAYRRRVRGPPPGKHGWMESAAILMGLASVEGLYVLDHALYGGPEGPGPISIITSLSLPAFALMALLLANDAKLCPSRMRRRGLVAAAVGFLLFPLWHSAFLTGSTIVILSTGALGWQDYAPPAVLLEYVGYMVVLVFAAVVAVRVAGSAQMAFELPPRALTRFGLGIGLPVLSAALLLLAEISGTASFRFYTLLRSLWAASLPLVLFYAVVHYRLFDVDARIKVGLKGGVIGGVYLVVLFLANKTGEIVITAAVSGATDIPGLSLILGILAAALLLFALRPIERMAQGFADVTMPHARRVAHLPRNERLARYREQAEIAWMDGTISVRERALLDRLARHLRLTPATASQIERLFSRAPVSVASG